MPDITKCDNGSCPSAKLCWRYVCIPSEYQYYSHFTIPEGMNKCSSFWEMNIDRKKNYLDAIGTSQGKINFSHKK